MRDDDAMSLLPECFRNDEDLEKLDAIIDRAAANSRWSNVDVARALCRLFRYIIGERG